MCLLAEEALNASTALNSKPVLSEESISFSIFVKKKQQQKNSEVLIVLLPQIFFLLFVQCVALRYLYLIYLLFSSERLTMSNSFLCLLFYLPVPTFELRVETSTSLLEEIRQLT